MKRLKTTWDVWRTGRDGPAAIARVQQTRLTELVEFARARSPFYQKLYQHTPEPINKLQNLPPVTKPELMANFDDWVTDPVVTRAGVEAFIADKTLVGQLYLGRFAVWTTSGTTGTPGIFLHDSKALGIYDILLAVRGWLGRVTSSHLLIIPRHGFRVAIVVATGGHFAGVSSCERFPRHYPWLSNRIRTFSALVPLVKLVAALNDFQPIVLAGYPSALLLLAREQTQGALDIHLLFILTSGEWLDPATCHQLETAFKCGVRDMYGASEFIYIAFTCSQRCLHPNADWLILEAVDNDYKPVPPGQASRTVLLTNLANRVQPLIRYDLGDSITVSPVPCPCGSPLPAIRVEGRRDETLSFQTPEGEQVQVLPMVLITLIEDTPGVHRFQVIQTAPAVLSIRLEVVPGSDGGQVWDRVARRLQDYLATQGLSFVAVRQSLEPPHCNPISGKFRQVWAKC